MNGGKDIHIFDSMQTAHFNKANRTLKHTELLKKCKQRMYISITWPRCEHRRTHTTDIITERQKTARKAGSKGIEQG